MKKILLTTAACISFFAIHAQDMMGIRNSNYAGVTGIDLNPASIVDSRIKLDINLLTVGVTVDNNYLFIPKKELKFVGIKNIVKKVDDKKYLDKYEFGGSDKLMWVASTIQGPSAMVNLGNHSFALSYNIRTAISFRDIQFAQAKFAFTDVNFDPIETALLNGNTNGFPSAADPTKVFSAPNFKVNALGWAEWDLTYGAYVFKKGRNALKTAVTLKYLQGAGGGYAKNADIDFFVHDDGIKDTSLSVRVNNIDYARVSFDSYSSSNAKKYGDYVHGKGIGWNFGLEWQWRRKDPATYTYEMDGRTREDKEVNKYILKVGASLIDFGKITFKDEWAGVYNISSSDADYIQNNTLLYNAGYSANNYDWYHDEFKSNEDFDTTYSVMFYGDPNRSRVGNKFSMALPSAFSLQVDYNVYKKFYLNATVIQAVKHGENQVVRANMLAFTPRYETDWFEAAVPVTYFNNRDTRVGLAFRLGTIIIGSDKVGSLFGLSDLTGMDVYAGLKFSLLNSKPNDKDHDRVSDAKDKCPDVAGLWKFEGCPDRDGDDVQDAQDMCPDEKGLIALQGCPDRDNDGIADKNDDCPDVPGIALYKGCPDTDSDGIIDMKDECPTIPGLQVYNGCPDTDGDSIPDPKDECPNKKGLREFNGCPDTDADGLPDNKDECPTEIGPASNKGCPVKVVEVPKETAPVKVELTKEEQEIINTVFSNLQFETGKSVIKTSSYESLDKLVDLLKKKPAFKLTIEGHTDNVGKPASNLLLSKNRAKSAKTYLTDKGIDATRITTNGFGQKKPVATNATPDGRAKNRRVEFTIVQ